MSNGSLSEHFLHIFLKVESREFIILCKLYIVFLYLHIILTRVRMHVVETKFCCAVLWTKLHTPQRPDMV